MKHFEDVKRYEDIIKKISGNNNLNIKNIDCKFYVDNNFCLVTLENTEGYKYYYLFFKEKLLSVAISDLDFSDFIDVVKIDEQNNLWVLSRNCDKETIDIYNKEGMCIFSKTGNQIDITGNTIILRSYDNNTEIRKCEKIPFSGCMQSSCGYNMNICKKK